MNKKAFTLVELITVIVILGAIALVVIPSTTRLFQSGKDEQMKNDAKELIGKAKYYYKMNGTINFTLNDLWNNSSRTDGYGNSYDYNTSKVLYNKSDNVYTILIKAGTHCLSSKKDGTSCEYIKENDIDKSYVIEVK